MLLSAVSVLVVAQSSSEIPEGLMNNSVYMVVCMIWGFSMLFPHLLGKCQSIPRKDCARSALFLISELCCSLYYLCRLCCSVYCLCKCALYKCHRVSTQLQVNISYRIISYHIISYHIIAYIISYIICLDINWKTRDSELAHNLHIKYRLVSVFWADTDYAMSQPRIPQSD